MAISILKVNRIKYIAGYFGHQSLFLGGVIMRILLVEDDVKIASFIVKGLKAAGYAVDHAPDGEQGLHQDVTDPYDTAIINMHAAKLTAFQSSRMRKEGCNIHHHPERQSFDRRSRVKGLQTRSDDYLTKPFSFSELLRPGAHPDPEGERPFRANPPDLGDLSMNLLTREVTGG